MSSFLLDSQQKIEQRNDWVGSPTMQTPLMKCATDENKVIRDEIDELARGLFFKKKHVNELEQQIAANQKDVKQLEQEIAVKQKRYDENRIIAENELMRMRSSSRPRQSPYTVGKASFVTLARDAQKVADKAKALARSSSSRR